MILFTLLMFPLLIFPPFLNSFFSASPASVGRSLQFDLVVRPLSQSNPFWGGRKGRGKGEWDHTQNAVSCCCCCCVNEPVDMWKCGWCATYVTWCAVLGARPPSLWWLCCKWSLAPATNSRWSTAWSFYLQDKHSGSMKRALSCFCYCCRPQNNNNNINWWIVGIAELLRQTEFRAGHWLRVSKLWRRESLRSRMRCCCCCCPSEYYRVASTQSSY